MVDVGGDEHLDVLERALGLAATPAPGVVSLEHLVEILGLQRRAVLDDLTGRTQAERTAATTRTDGAGLAVVGHPRPQTERDEPTDEQD